MKSYKVIKQLQAIAEYAQDNIDVNDRENSKVWRDDITACNKAIRIIRKNKRADEQFWKGVALGSFVAVMLCLIDAITSM